MEAESRCRALLDLTARIDRAAGIDAAVDIAAASRPFFAGLTAHLDGASFARALSEFNDRVVERVLQLTAAEQRLPAVPWCWLALGSEGRYEQTFVTDQDNGLLFSAADSREAEALRQLFVPFGQAVNERLNRCGFAYCGGQVMAGNPRWCLSLEEWQRQFAEWVRRPEPLALMHGTIFFDFRPLHGHVALGGKLRCYLLALTRETPAFLHLMAANALQAQPPLNFLGDVTREGAGEGGGVDLKKSGTRIFVDAARIFALAHGVEEVHTPGRLAAAGEAAGLLPEEIEAATGAYSQLQRLRVRRQGRVLLAGGRPDHRVDPDDMNDLDQAILRESLKQARRLQQRLKLNYAL